jgi:hypothetical protein
VQSEDALLWARMRKEVAEVHLLSLSPPDHSESESPRVGQMTVPLRVEQAAEVAERSATARTKRFHSRPQACLARVETIRVQLRGQMERL